MIMTSIRENVHDGFRIIVKHQAVAADTFDPDNSHFLLNCQNTDEINYLVKSFPRQQLPHVGILLRIKEGHVNSTDWRC